MTKEELELKKLQEELKALEFNNANAETDRMLERQYKYTRIFVMLYTAVIVTFGAAFTLIGVINQVMKS